MEIHLWGCYKPNKISVDLKKSLKDKINVKIKKEIYKISDKLKIAPARLYEYFIWQISPIPLDVLLDIAKIYEIPFKDIEKNIIFYKQMFVPIKNSIKIPRLPIKINPYLTSIVANLFFDGSVPKDGKGTYYNQKNKKIMSDFINKIKSVFGEVQYSLKLDHRGVLKCRFPRLIGEICRSIYNVRSFGTFDSRVPDKIFNMSRNHKIAFVLTGILDEGSITYDGQIIFGVSNKLLCEDVKKLCYEIGLETTKVTRKSKSNHYYFYIKSQDKLLELINLINKNYPIISLNYKEERLKCYFEIKKHPGLRTKKGGDSRKKRILEALKKGEKSINQLSVKLLIPPKSLRRHLNFLLNKNKVNKKKIGRGYIYFLTSLH